MTKKIYALAALALATAPAFADDLWNQQVGLPAGFNGALDDQFIDATNMPLSSYQVSDVIVGAGGWDVNSVSMEILDPSGPSITQAVLNVFANTGQNLLPAVQNDPTAGATVNVQMTSLGNIGVNNAPVYLMTVTGLNLQLSAGEYWIGLTGITNGLSLAGNGIQDAYTTVNSAGAAVESAWINPSGQWGVGNTWQGLNGITGDTPNDYGAIDIQGVSAAPEPASMALLGLGIVGLISRRRNRK